MTIEPAMFGRDINRLKGFAMPATDDEDALLRFAHEEIKTDPENEPAVLPDYRPLPKPQWQPHPDLWVFVLMGRLMIFIGILLGRGNRTGVFETFPFAGTLCVIVGGIIYWLARRAGKDPNCEEKVSRAAESPGEKKEKSLRLIVALLVIAIAVGVVFVVLPRVVR